MSMLNCLKMNSSFVTARDGTGCFQPSWPDSPRSGDQASDGLVQPSSNEVPVLDDASL